MRNILILFFIPTFLFAASITEITGGYTKACLRAFKDENAFKSFKQDPDYRVVLEHVNYDQGKAYLQVVIDKAPFILKKLEKCRENDLLGSPITFSYGKEYGSFSPTTLRYMKVAGDILTLFGNLENAKIVEIGGGYGGQCKVLSEFVKFKEYTVIDLPEPALLTKKYLERLNVKNVISQSSKDLLPIKEYDLVISNYAFSEISKDEQFAYIEKILNQSKNGYLTVNFVSPIFSIQSLSIEELISVLQLPRRKISIQNENPSTGANFLITWTEKK